MTVNPPVEVAERGPGFVTTTFCAPTASVPLVVQVMEVEPEALCVEVIAQVCPPTVTVEEGKNPVPDKVIDVPATPLEGVTEVSVGATALTLTVTVAVIEPAELLASMVKEVEDRVVAGVPVITQVLALTERFAAAKATELAGSITQETGAPFMERIGLIVRGEPMVPEPAG
jgi:hypothetical protein